MQSCISQPQQVIAKKSFTSCATKLRRSSFSKSLMQHCCVGYLLSSVPQVAGGGCGWSNTQMRYTEICGSLSNEICMSNTRRSVYSMNKLTCQHKSLPSVHTAPTWLGVSEVLACVIILKEMLDKGPFANRPPQCHKGGHHHPGIGGRGNRASPELPGCRQETALKNSKN